MLLGKIYELDAEMYSALKTIPERLLVSLSTSLLLHALSQSPISMKSLSYPYH